MTRLAATAMLAGLLWLQLVQGPFGFWGCDWSLCGLLVLGLSLRSSAYPLTAVTLGLARDIFSVAPMGAQALCLGVTALVVRFLSGLVILESGWIQGTVFFTGMVVYNVLFFSLGKMCGFLDGGFWACFVMMFPKVLISVLFCWLLLFVLSRGTRYRITS